MRDKCRFTSGFADFGYRFDPANFEKEKAPPKQGLILKNNSLRRLVLIELVSSLLDLIQTLVMNTWKQYSPKVNEGQIFKVTTGSPKSLKVTQVTLGANSGDF